VSARARHRRNRVRRRTWWSAFFIGLVLIAVPAAGALSADTTGQSDHREPAGATRLVEPRTPSGVPGAGPTESVEPGRILIEAIGVSAAVEVVGLAADGTLGIPTDVATVGWFAGSSRPGEMGPAVMVGHVDSVDGPAVFARLAELRAGDLVTVEDGAGSALTFTVSAVTRHPKRSFPTDAVYGPTPDAELHLITCGGRYDRDDGYTDNVVVTAKVATD
jgi:Sortase domain